jgi:carboxypeptidase T
MHETRRACLILAFVVLTGTAALPSLLNATDRPALLRLKPADMHAVLPSLAAQGYDILGVDLETGTVDVVGTATDVTAFAAQGIPVTIVRYLDGAQPQVDPKYLDPGELEEHLERIQARYSNIAHLFVLGHTEEGRPYYAMKISDNVMAEEDEPAVFFIGEHHAREVMTPEIALDLVNTLVRNYGSNAFVTDVVNRTEVWVMPGHNPDGSNHVFTADTFWRKNRRDNGGGIFGVDNNRNYPFRWGACNGSSGNPADETYRGPSPGSEPETTALTALALEQRPVFALSYHSYGELVLHSYGCSGSKPPDRAVVEDIGVQLASRLKRDSGNGGYTPGYPWQILYPVDGEMQDWFYSQLGTLAFTIEVNSSAQGFQPAYDVWRNSTVERNRPGWIYLLRRLDGPSVRGHVTDATTGEPLEARVLIDEIPLTADEVPRTSEPLHGRYQRILLPGAYHLRVRAPGYQEQVIAVNVGGSAVDLDVQLSPVR